MNTISRNDRCPCGSGKKFKKCCGASPDAPAKEYVNDAHRWMDENILKGRYPDLYGFLVLADHDIPAGEIWEQLRYWSEKHLGYAGDRSRRFHEIVDEVIEHQSRLDAEEGYDPIFCHKGCSNCCRQPVACTDDEARLILEYCRERGVNVDYDKLKRQLAHIEYDRNGDFTGITTWNNQPPEDQGCAFLDEADGSCVIWEVRPFVCRVHLAAATDIYCKTHNGEIDGRAAGIHYPQCGYILSAVFTIHHDSIGKMMNRLLIDIA